jgi:hypothetical protein
VNKKSSFDNNKGEDKNNGEVDVKAFYLLPW